MLSAETITAFFIASALLAIAPGPDNLFVLTQSALHGKLSGLMVVLGLCSGLLVHTGAVVFGVAVIFQASDLAFSMLKLAGAGYLVYLAWIAFRSTPQSISMDGGQKDCLKVLYRRGIIMNITNPKVSLFFLAFLPQFADQARGPISLQMLMLGGIFIVATILVFGSAALIGGSLGNRLNRSERAQTLMNRVAGSIYIGLALKLATTGR